MSALPFASILPLPQNFNPNAIRCCNGLRHTTKLPNNNNNGGARFPEKNVLIHPSSIAPPPRPRRIILVRHGQSEWNVDEAVYTRVADPNVVFFDAKVRETS